jgi:hypothetical protein
MESMATQVSVATYVWRSKIHTAMAAIADALAAFGSGKDLELPRVRRTVQDVIGTYSNDDDAEWSPLELHGIALHVRDLAQALAELILHVPQAQFLIPLQDELLVTGEDLGLSAEFAGTSLPSTPSADEWVKWPSD